MSLSIGGLALNNNVSAERAIWLTAPAHEFSRLLPQGEVRFFGGSSSYSTVCTDAVEDSGIINPIRARALTHGLGPDSVPCDDPITPPRPPALPTELLTEILSLAFEFCLSQFGLVNERRFYADMAANPRRRTSHYSPVLYYVILAMGCKYLEPSRHEMVSKTCTDPNDFATRGAVYINWARFTLEQEWTQPELSTITALNCLAVYLYGQGLDGPATLYNGIAIRLCEDCKQILDGHAWLRLIEVLVAVGLHLGLHRLKATPAYFRRFGNEDEKARADTFYAALQSNVMFCISVGRNVPFSVDEIDQALPLVDGEAEFDKPEHRSTAFHLASKLVLIVTKMMRSVYTLDVNVSLGEDARRCQSFI